ncbi:MAG: hypothetical protein LBF82_04260 [Lactobacillales bacterium]|jgi:hypothetical protein|nr:hypothetical protein [Lactobacillales bacterium]
MKKEVKVMTLFLFITVCVLLSCMRAGADAAVLRQIDGKPVTAPGQLVEFVGTNGFDGPGIDVHRGIDFFRKNDSIDRWMVMQVEGDYALIVKRNKIGLQRYGGSTYNQSDIKTTVETWSGNLPPIEFNGKPFRDYVAPVRLEGADQNSPSGYNLTDQGHYRTAVDPSGDKIAFIPSLIDVDSKADNNLNAGKDNWQAFDMIFNVYKENIPKISNHSSDLALLEKGTFQALASEYEDMNKTWLRSPLGRPTKVALINNGGKICNFDIEIDPYTDSYICNFIRPAFWVRISPPLQEILEKRSRILARIIREALPSGVVPWKLILAEMGYIEKLPESAAVTPHIKQDCQDFARTFQSRKDEMCPVQEARAHLGNIVEKWKAICPGGEFNEMDQVLTEMGTGAVAALKLSEEANGTTHLQLLKEAGNNEQALVAMSYHGGFHTGGIKWMLEKLNWYKKRDSETGEFGSKGDRFWDGFERFLKENSSKYQNENN